jgi:hypothetical protein
MAGNDAGLCRLCAPILGLADLRRVEKAPLNRARHPMHRALADLAGLSLGFELGRDLLQKLRPQLMVDRPANANSKSISSVVRASGIVGRLRAGRGTMAPGALRLQG